MTDSIRIANCSGFYGDKLGAARDMVDGGPIDVLTGDYLAELTMTILYNQRSKDADKGYVGTFLKQVADVLADCKSRGIKIVSNAGGLNPKGMSEAVKAIAAEQGIDVKVAYIDGDDLIPRLAHLQEQGEIFESIDTHQPLAGSGKPAVTANAYLGAWGIKAALDAGADIVICPRVTDAAVVIGPAAWKFNWQRNDYDALAGALAAGHIIECGAQATGGNYAFFQEVPSFHNMGYPIAEIEANGNFTVTKHPGTGGLVSVGTVKAQLLYEISSPAYLNPDVIAHFDTLSIEQQGEDRVYVSGCRGSTPPMTHKVCINTQGGFRNGMEMILTGLDIEEKAEIFTDTLFASVGRRDQFDEVTVELIRNDKQDPQTNEEAYARLRINVKSRDPERVGRIFSAKIIELALANFPGFISNAGGSSGGPFISYWPALVDSRYITETVHLDDDTIEILPTAQLDLEPMYYQKLPVSIPDYPKGDMVKLPLGRLFGTRSGDKGGNANVGIWARTPEAFGFLYEFLTVERFKSLFDDLADFDIERFELPNLHALNFYIHGILGEGVSSSVRIDGQAKTLGEYMRARIIEVPAALAAQLDTDKQAG